jgi:hypothetical protein
LPEEARQLHSHDEYYTIARLALTYILRHIIPQTHGKE